MPPCLPDPESRDPLSREHRREDNRSRGPLKVTTSWVVPWQTPFFHATPPPPVCSKDGTERGPWLFVLPVETAGTWTAVPGQR